jgi:glycosyltransferase involved in cell wall biosynthesis
LIIAFDTWILSRRYRYQGYYVYARRLLEEFQKLHTSANSVTVSPFVARGSENDANEFVADNGFRPAHSDLLRMGRLWRCGGATLAALGTKADILFSPTSYVCPLGLVPVVAMVADATPLRLPSHLFVANSVMRTFSYMATRFSQRVLTISECSKRDLVEFYKVAPEKITVTYCGYHQELFNTNTLGSEALEVLLNRFGIRRPYIFHHGTIQPRKNFQRLIEAYAQVMDRNRNLDMQLVLAGSFGWQYEPIVRAGTELKGRGKVIFTGPLPEKELALLLKGSAASVIPSLYEGFCLPMVEAMACGVPTIAANTSCLPEVSGGVLRYFDPLSVDDMAARIEELLEDGSLREQLARDGLKRASFFSWEKCAKETLDLLVKTHEELAG